MILDKTCEDLVRNGYDNKLAEILRLEGWKEEEIESYILSLSSK